jgi:hypothetical protein
MAVALFAILMGAWPMYVRLGAAWVEEERGRAQEQDTNGPRPLSSLLRLGDL